MIRKYEDYFSEDAIIAVLCRIRLHRASSIHRRRFYRKAFELVPETDFSDLNRLFPPRKLWHQYRPNKNERKIHAQHSFRALHKCIVRNMWRKPAPDWAVELNRFIKTLQQRVLVDDSFRFRIPEIVPQPKKNPDEYRAIASFPNIEDKVVDIINAKYLRERLEVCLEDCARAFRSGSKRHLDRNSAIDSIYRIRQAHPKSALYVTECDIRGFFDCVHHSVAKESLRISIQLLRVRKPELSVDPRAVEIFNRYLECYSFSRTTLQLEPNLKKLTKNPKAVYKWPISDKTKSPDNLNYYHSNPRACLIGIPQGGAHSCLIANLVLDLADKEVSLSLHSGSGDSVYLRYCDDIIIITEHEQDCRAATEAYYRALQAVKLPYHLPTSLDGSDKQFFENSKTKECFRWGEKRPSTRQFPWIQFLGYQIRYDERIRIRPSSIRKQCDKIKLLSESLRKQVIRRKTKVTRRRLVYRFNSKLWAFSTGRVQLHIDHKRPLPMCWANGFNQLSKRSFDPKHIRKLDQFAGKERRRLMKHLMKFELGKGTQKIRRKSKQLRYYGNPFSHRRQFKHSDSGNLR